MTAITGMAYPDPDPAMHDPAGMIGSIKVEVYWSTRVINTDGNAKLIL
jgi:hypothetical protein